MSAQMNPFDKFLWRSSWYLLGVVVITIVLALSFGIRARLELGYWPNYGNPDPKQLGWDYHLSLLMLSILATLPALIINCFVGLILLGRSQLKHAKVVLSITVVTFLTLWGCCYTDPVDQFIGWVLD